MKKTIFFVCLLIIGFANAQNDNQNTNSNKLTFAKGTNFINGSLFFNTTKTVTTTSIEQENTRLGIGINASYAHAISKDLFIGLGIGYSNNTRENDLSGGNSIETIQNTFRVFPYVRYYKGVGKNLAFFVQGETQFGFGKNKTDGQETFKTDDVFIGVRPGFTFMISKCLGLETTIGALGYSNNKLENVNSNTESKVSGFDFSFNPSDIIFGVSYYF